MHRAWEAGEGRGEGLEMKQAKNFWNEGREGAKGFDRSHDVLERKQFDGGV